MVIKKDFLIRNFDQSCSSTWLSCLLIELNFLYQMLAESSLTAALIETSEAKILWFVSEHSSLDLNWIFNQNSKFGGQLNLILVLIDSVIFLLPKNIWFSFFCASVLEFWSKIQIKLNGEHSMANTKIMWSEILSKTKATLDLGINWLKWFFSIGSHLIQV